MKPGQKLIIDGDVVDVVHVCDGPDDGLIDVDYRGCRFVLPTVFLDHIVVLETKIRDLDAGYTEALTDAERWCSELDSLEERFDANYDEAVLLRAALEQISYGTTCPDCEGGINLEENESCPQCNNDGVYRLSFDEMIYVAQDALDRVGISAVFCRVCGALKHPPSVPHTSKAEGLKFCGRCGRVATVKSAHGPEVLDRRKACGNPVPDQDDDPDQDDE